MNVLDLIPIHEKLIMLEDAIRKEVPRPKSQSRALGLFDLLTTVQNGFDRYSLNGAESYLQCLEDLLSRLEQAEMTINKWVDEIAPDWLEVAGG
ncbi:hypothetical protein [Alicyclobacillus ferrooxydans]|uniref:Uncharacterized protein n=1 Tax=Alicyclobacillus ferrooxydans TaxID=471514 RepID=A0A0P9EY15_9BACL|nr:hypothetical protein [Alicyclobacillus ferrooxydans]KPV44031.1 hypothetical protein AN477_08975 [Alicyclobacillus ferrooxydans]